MRVEGPAPRFSPPAACATLGEGAGQEEGLGTVLLFSGWCTSQGGLGKAGETEEEGVGAASSPSTTWLCPWPVGLLAWSHL